MFASINLDGATESAWKRVLTRDGTAAPAGHIEIIRATTAPDVRCLKADGRSFQAGAALQFSAGQKSYLDRCVAVSTCGGAPGSRHPLWVFSLLDAFDKPSYLVLAARLRSFDLLASGPLGGRCLTNAAGLRNALFCLFHSLVEDREFLLRGGPGSHCPIKLRVAHIELRFQLL